MHRVVHLTLASVALRLHLLRLLRRQSHCPAAGGAFSGDISVAFAFGGRSIFCTYTSPDVNFSSANRLPFSAFACWHVAGVVTFSGVVGVRGLHISSILAAAAPFLPEATGLQVGACRVDATVTANVALFAFACSSF
jgi:hypothetical protein